MSWLTTPVPGKVHSYRRWTRAEIFQHWALVVTFAVLAVTGFALSYPNAWIFRPLAAFRQTFDLRGVVHRASATVFFFLGIYHLVYMVVTDRGRNLWKALRPKTKDLTDMRESVLFNLGRRSSAPAFAHFSYMEKAEYFALLWGAVIMGATGFMLWFEQLTLRFFPKWTLDLLTVVHLYEAWLATLAIIVWHLYFVILNPDVYPVQTSMFTGTLTAAEMREEHLDEWQKMQSELTKPDGDKPVSSTTEDASADENTASSPR